MWGQAIEVFRKYMGTGLVVAWFLLAVVYLFLCEKRRPRRILFVYVPVAVLLCFFNPLFFGLFDRLVVGGYFRICWLLPMIVVIAYAVILICGSLKGRNGAFFAVASVLLTIVSGRLVYSSPLYSRAENSYHVPDSVMRLCDAVVVPGREVMAAFPEELLLYVRQYSAYVCMPYGREVVMGEYNELHEQMEAETVDLETLVPLVREANCHFCILPAGRAMRGSPEDYGWVRFWETDGYVIYRDPATELVIPELTAD